MADEIVVPELCVSVVTGETLYPDENGFSSACAEFETSDKNLVAAPEKAKREERTQSLSFPASDGVCRNEVKGTQRSRASARLRKVLPFGR